MDHKLKIGDVVNNFTVSKIEDLPEYDGVAYLMEHKLAHAPLLWLANDDQNKSFSISFKTAPKDDTGVFHILEHSVLCGSDKYPVKEPFVNLLKTSMQTFLNAMTFPDKTMYPVASTNQKDLENLMSVYLDAVFHPRFLHVPQILEQEGWHTELDESGHLHFNGVVLNEMKGVMQDPGDMAELHMNRALFPDTCYGFESGGYPDAITDLTYEQFVATHKAHYNLANSYTIIYGDLDIDATLALIDDAFAHAPLGGEKDSTPFELIAQKPVKPEPQTVEMHTSKDAARVNIAYVINPTDTPEGVFEQNAISVALDALAGSSEAPLKRAMLELGLADDFSAQLMPEGLQPYVLMSFTGAKPELKEHARAYVEDALKKILAEGLPRDKFEAALASLEFSLREQDFSYPNGLYIAMGALTTWLYNKDMVLDGIKFEDALKEMKAALDSNYYAELLERLILNSEHTAQVSIVPVNTELESQEDKKLAALEAELNDEKKAAIEKSVSELRAIQEAEDAPEDVAKLPRLKLSEVGEGAEPHEVREDTLDDGHKLYRHMLHTHKISYLNAYFDLAHLTNDELFIASYIPTLITNVSTEHTSASDLDTKIESSLGDLTATLSASGILGQPTTATPRMIVSARALEDQTQTMCDLMYEVLSETRYDELDKIKNLLLQLKIRLESTFLNAGNTTAMVAANAPYSAVMNFKFETSGPNKYLHLKKLLANWETEGEAFCNKLAQVAAKVFVNNKLELSVAASDEGYETIKKVEKLSALPHLNNTDVAYEARLAEVAHTAYIVPSNVNYVASTLNTNEDDMSLEGALMIARRLFSFDYLWNEVRVKGGAYGCSFAFGLPSLRAFSSYRDPHLDETLERYSKAGAWLKNWDPTEDEFEGYKVASIAAIDAPQKTFAKMTARDTMRFSHIADNHTHQQREWVKHVSLDDMHSLGAHLDSKAESLAFVGNKASAEASTIAWNVVELMPTQA